MKYIVLIVLLISIIGCQNRIEKNPFIGTWNRCLRNGEYLEFKIDDNYTMSLGSSEDEIFLLSNKFENNSLIVKGINVSLPNEIDTLVLTFKSNNKIIFKSSWMNQIIELNKTENKIGDIDSIDLENWKKKTILKFQKRAELYNCPDLRTEDEKIIHDLGDVNLEEEILEEIPVEFLKDSIK